MISDFCNLNIGTWSCWSTWSPCPHCGSGTRERTRQCIAGHNSFEIAEGCLGSNHEIEPCFNSPCSGNFHLKNILKL